METYKEITAIFMQTQIDFVEKMYWGFIQSERGGMNGIADYRNYMVYELEKSIKSLKQ